MGKINVLDKQIAELIAAGEVVERPASVIKELLENSIDAGARAVTVEIKNGGVSYMRVTDDGCGILRDDVRSAFLRHATSKLRTCEDLDNIGTLGFRGEALASVCAVARVDLLTRSIEENIGTSYKINGGEEIEFSEAGCPVGTTIIVRNLFYNVPARLKFLKKDVSEGNAVSAVMDKIALSHPEISFVYIKDGKQMLKTAGDSNLKSAVYSVYGRDFAKTLIPVDYELCGIKVRGYVSRPEGARPNRNMQNFFINGRYIKSRTASAALEEASKGSVMVGKYLSCVLHLNISGNMVDVNVHPAKMEVRFMNERPIFDAVYHAVKSALLKSDERKQMEIKAPQNPSPFTTMFRDISLMNPDEKAEPQESPLFTESPRQNSSGAAVDLRDLPYDHKPAKAAVKRTFESAAPPASRFDTNSADSADDVFKELDSVALPPQLSKQTDDLQEIPAYDEPQAETENQDEPSLLPLSSEISFRYIGEAFKTYIIIEKPNDELVLIDKHAAHERIIYERLKNGDAQIFAQGLITPVIVTLNKTDYDSVLRNLSVFQRLCFEVDDFGNGSVIVRAAPQFLERADISQTVMEIAGYLTDNKQELNTERMDHIFHSVACKSAIKAGNLSSSRELIELALKVENDSTLRYCPHGRPICLVLKRHEIEKQFGRA